MTLERNLHIVAERMRVRKFILNYWIISNIVLIILTVLLLSEEVFSTDISNSKDYITDCDKLRPSQTHLFIKDGQEKKLLSVKPINTPQISLYLQENNSCRRVLFDEHGYALYFHFQKNNFPGISIYTFSKTQTQFYKWNGHSYELINLEESTKLNKKALELFRNGQIQEAISLWMQAAEITKVPGLELSANAEVLNNLGFAYYKLGKDYYGKAEDYLKSSLKIDPSRWSAHLNLAELYLKEKRDGEALESFKALLNSKPDYKYRDSILSKIKSLNTKQKMQSGFEKNMVLDPLSAFVNRVAKEVYFHGDEDSKLIRFIADFNNDGLSDIAVASSIEWGNAGGNWSIYLKQKNGKYEYIEELFFHPLAIAIQPFEKGTAKIVIYCRSNALEGSFQTILFSDYGSIQYGSEEYESAKDDNWKFDELYGGLRENPISEYCYFRDYLSKTCEWKKGY